VEPLELDTSIDELEMRVERLRSLYEQYFMGIEKIAPAVAHKDVTRRIDILRHEQIRNTAKRFRLQMIIQRYNTFQQYWQRVLREIENGTYKRHVLRAERSMAASRVSSIPAARATEPVVVAEAAPDNEGPASSRPRKSQVPGSLRHSIPISPRHSTLPPPEKVEAFTRALERDLAAALDGDLDFGAIKNDLIDRSLELDDPPINTINVSRRQEVPRATPSRVQPSNVAATKPAAPPRGPLRLPAQSAIGGHGLPPPAPKLAVSPVQRIMTQTGTRAAAVASPVAPRPKPEPSPPTGTLSAERVRALHHELVEAKVRTHEAGEVSLSLLTHKLETTAQALRVKHSGKQIDFAVVIKDGKAIVKPIVR